MKEVKNSFKQQILNDVQMDTQTTFMNNGDIKIFACPWEQDKAPVTASVEPPFFLACNNYGEENRINAQILDFFS